ncbi:MAG: hypothetical protein U0936_00480 [Planctomycetaceae bacterium]
MFRFALTIFVSAFLLFQVQPLIGRFILPWFGGGPSIWTSCMLFFQIILLGGYLYAHLLSVYLKTRAQVITHTILLAASLLFLPISPSDSWKPTSDQSPLLHILLLLLATVGGPYFMLSSTGPLMQKWFSQTSPGRSPYRLYALSNIGSLLALLSYPFVFEPWLTLRQQVFSWSSVYGGYVLLAGWCAAGLWKVSNSETALEISTETNSAELTTSADNRVPRPSIASMLLWLGLAASSSAMLLATTNQLCIDVATVPFLWVLPLGLYLISFIICFDSPQWYDRRAWGLLLIVCCPVACWVIDEGADVNITKQVVIYSTILFACCMTCHGELVSNKPHPKHLTLFFVLTSAGGALGGVFVAIVAPYLFKGYWEYHIGLVACALMTLLAWCGQRVWLRGPSPQFWIWTLTVTGQVVAGIYYVYSPIAASISDKNEVILVGVFTIIQLFGLIATGSRERNLLGFLTAVTAFSVLQPAWIFWFGSWRFPGLIGTEIKTALVLIPLTSILVAFALYGLGHIPSDRARRFWMLGALYAAVAGVTFAVLKLEWLESWQVYSLGYTAAAAVLMEWSSIGIRGPDRASLGFWFWVPAITLLLLLSNYLAQIVESDNKTTDDSRLVHVSRNFYGVLRVKYEGSDPDDEDFIPPKNALTHGQIRHGFQFVDDYWKRQPTTYYGRESGVGLAVKVARRLAAESDQHTLKVGVVGLGTGTMAAYAEKGEFFRFYEINPDVVELSDKIFTYLNDAPQRPQVIIGDARIEMERELAKAESQQFDVLAIDAFSSDAIPVHLLTSECGEIYRQHLRKGGVLAIHISNRFLDLNPVSRGMAEKLGWQAIRIDNGDEYLSGVFSSTWILLTENPEFVNDSEITEAIDPWGEEERILHWTDDYSGLWQVLSF